MVPLLGALAPLLGRRARSRLVWVRRPSYSHGGSRALTTGRFMNGVPGVSEQTTA